MPFRFETANERWKWFLRTADYDGWTNWDTWQTWVLISNNHPLDDSNTIAYKIVASGKTVQQFADWALQKIIGPVNAETLRNAQEFTEEEEVAAMQERDLEQWMAAAQRAHPDDPEAQKQYVERLRELSYGFFGPPQPTNVNNHLIEEGKVNWQEIYDWISYDIKDQREQGYDDWWV